MDTEKPGVSAETPLSVRELSAMLGDYIGRLGRVWVEGEIVTIKQYGNLYYITFRDAAADMSVTVVAAASTVDGCEVPLKEGSRVVIHAAMEWWSKRGELRVRGHAIKPVGEGELRARIEQLRAQLFAEGLFEPSRKRQLPFLPRKVGLITGRDTDAKHDVMVRTRERWPATRFELREIPLQQKDTPLLAVAAMHELEADPEVDVIVFARGGGSFEDLLPWSDEGLVRAVVKALKPTVSAIGHEPDHPILDDAADVRAATPTDVARWIVPSLNEENARVGRSISRMRDLRSSWLQSEQRHLGLALQVLRAHSPRGIVEQQLQRLTHQREQAKSRLQLRLQRELSTVQQRRTALNALSPFQVLARGYAVATTADGKVIKRPADVAVGKDFNLRLHEGAISAQRTKE